MADRMEFPKTMKEFIDNFSFKDTEEVYTNGAELIPVFRVEQALEHYEKEIRAKDIDELTEYRAIGTPTQILEKIGGLCVELGKYACIGTVEELQSMKEKNDTLRALYEDARKEGNHLIAKERAAAIDEFAHRIRSKVMAEIDDCADELDWIDEIAEQMKGE